MSYADNTERWMHEAVANGDLGDPFGKMRESAADFVYSMAAYWAAHPDVYEAELLALTDILRKAGVKPKSNVIRIQTDENPEKCRYLSEGLCMGQKCMPECTPNIGYCPLQEKSA